MPSPALLGAQRFEADSTGNRPDAATSSSTANTKGSYTELEASRTFDSQAMVVVAGPSGTQGDVLYDYAIGAAGSEQIAVANILFGERIIHCDRFFVPFGVPAGTRSAVRAQHTSGGAGRTCHFGVIHIAGGALMGSPLQRCETAGANTADSGGTGVDPGATINTKGAYSELIASTSFDAKWMVVAMGMQDNPTPQNAGMRLDIAKGSAASEQVVAANLMLAPSTNSASMHPAFYSFPCDIPAGSRLAARLLSEINDASDRLIDVIAYLFG